MNDRLITQPVVVFVGSILVICSGLFTACHKQEDEPDPYIPQPVATQKQLDFFPAIAADQNLLADLPTVFPESSQYHLSSINVSGTKDTITAFEVRQVYNHRNQLTYKNFYDYREGRAWQHRYTFDEGNRLVKDESASYGFSISSEYYPARTNYTYEGDRLVKVVRNTVSPHNPLSDPTPNQTITYEYDGSRPIKAVILNYYVAEPQENNPYPQDSTRRQFTCADNGLTTVINDSVWDTPCFSLNCVASFSRVSRTQKQIDANGNLLTLASSVYSPLHPAGKATFTNEYNGPDGLISRQVNVSAGLVYRFQYQKK